MNVLQRLFINDKEFYKRVAVIAIPVTLQSLIAIGINLMGTVMLGTLGEYQLSASSLANNFFSLFQILCMGMGFGTAVMTAQFWGSSDISSIKSSVTIMYRINIVIALCFSAISFAAPGAVMRTYTNDTMIIGYGIQYVRILALTFTLQGLSLTTTIVLRSIGKVRIPLYSSIAAFTLNILLSWLLIFGKFGLPRMEIEGAAYATLLARVFEFIFICGYFFFKEQDVRYRIVDFFKPCGGNMKLFIKFAIPVIISDFLLGMGNNIMAIIIGHIGALFISANAIIMVVLQICTILTQGISNASSIVTGNTLGEGDKEKTYRQGVTFLALSTIVGILAAVLIQILAPSIIGMYRISTETREITFQLMNALSLTVIFQTVGSVMTKGVLRGGGDTKFLMIADILFLWIASVPLGILAAFVFGWPPFFIFICLRIDHILKSFWCINRLISKKWIRIIRQSEAQESALTAINSINVTD